MSAAPCGEAVSAAQQSAAASAAQLAAATNTAQFPETVSAVQLRQLLRAGAYSATAVTSWYLERIAALNPQLGAFNRVTSQLALEQALALDTARRQNPSRPLGQLWGLPLGHKDLVDVAGVPTTHGSRAFGSAPAQQDDPLVAQLHRAGAVCLGKTQVPEFGLSGHSENLIADPARNPAAPAYTAGGSSGGAAAAVAAQLLPFAPGSDAGGSIRIPAACCGIVGLKPGRGRLPVDAAAARAAARARAATAANASSAAHTDTTAHTDATAALTLTVQGPLARSVTDAALLYDAMLGDVTEANLWAVRHGTRRQLRIGVSFASVFDPELSIQVAPEVIRAVTDCAVALRELGHRVEFVDFDYLPGYYAAFENFWQWNFAQTSFAPATIAEFTPYAQHSYRRGQALSASEFQAAATRLHEIITGAVSQWREFDVVLTPTLNVAPRPLGFFERADPAQNFRLQCEAMPYTSVFNVAGWAALALPVPTHSYIFEVDQPAAATPVGVQLAAPGGQETLLLTLGAALESVFHGDKTPGQEPSL